MTKVLIVDDEKSIRNTLSEFLIKEHMDVTAVPDAVTAIGLLDQNFDIIVTDLIMPTISGLELVERIREISATIQIVIMTGEPTVDTAVRALKIGANDYLMKPIRRREFLKSIQNAAHIKRLHDEKTELERKNEQYRKSLESMVEARTNSLQMAMRSIVKLLATVVEARDPYTAGHQRRVGNLSAAIAKKLRLGEDSVEYLRIIGYIHDIGKIVIPGEILSKPGKMTRLEFEMIRSHSEMGFAMLSKVGLPQFIAEAIYQHHERCDGSGYPRGLKGDDILLEAKILAVADVVEAMTSHRPYRPALGLGAAISEIQSKAGSSFDKEVAAACLSLFESDLYEIDDQEYIVRFPLDNTKHPVN